MTINLAEEVEFVSNAVAKSRPRPPYAILCSVSNLLYCELRSFSNVTSLFTNNKSNIYTCFTPTPLPIVVNQVRMRRSSNLILYIALQTSNSCRGRSHRLVRKAPLGRHGTVGPINILKEQQPSFLEIPSDYPCRHD